MLRAALLVLLIACAGREAPEATVTAGDPAVELAAVAAADSAWQDASISRALERMAAMYAPEARVDFPGMEPIRGASAIRDLWAQIYADTSLRLGWTMERAELLPRTPYAYTIGRWRQRTASSDSSGTYVAVWQKQPDGRWLVIIDTAR